MNTLPVLLILLLATPALAGPVTNAPDPGTWAGIGLEALL
jgi:hypothetical protein